MKKDILGREIHEHDIVVVKGNYGCEMEVGVFIGKSVRTLNGVKTAKDMFLVANPTIKEVELKDKIMAKIVANKIASDDAKAKKAAQKADVPGTIYLMSRDQELVLYCGKCLITYYQDGKLIDQQTGHFYLSGGRWIGMPARVASSMTFNDFQKKTADRIYTGAWPTTKSVKKYEDVFSTIEIPKSFTIECPWSSTSSGTLVNHVFKQEVQVIE